MIHFWMILSMLVNHLKLEDLYDPLLDVIYFWMIISMCKLKVDV